MRRKLIACMLLLSGLCALGYAQSKSAEQPLVIKGRLTNCPEKELHIFFEDERGDFQMDNINVNDDGSFYFRTNKIHNPQITSIQQKNTQINDIFVAPAYELNITGDASDFNTLYKTTIIIGKGGESNKFRTLLNKYRSDHKNDKNWFEMEGSQLVVFAKEERRVKDSLAHIVFDGKAANDPYLAFFKKETLYNNQFNELYYLLTYTNIHKLGYEESTNFIRNNFDNNLLEHLSKDDYLISKDYKSWLIGTYLEYLLRLDDLKNPEANKTDAAKLEKIDKTFTGKVREYALWKHQSNEIEFSKSLEKLSATKEAGKPYSAHIKDLVYIKSIDNAFAKKQKELMLTAVGKPAPAFTLNSNDNKSFSLTDFKGKVVYLDLWASWCGPCRKETPYLTALYKKYKDDSRIAIISIAVADAEQAWRKALQEDNPSWLQLWDKTGEVQGAYAANMIPQFVVINKKGEIVNFNAPEPSTGKKLEDLLLKEMEL